VRAGSLFAGIGGFDLGLEWAGIEPAWQVEKDEFCQKVLNKHWPDVKRYGDIYDFIEKIKGGEVEPVDIITGGFPCQPFSQAGKREGKEDDRYLWPAMLEVISLLRPTWVIGENVAGILNMGFEDMLLELEGKGYRTESFIIPACAVNAPHRRDRVWIVGYSCGKRLQGDTRELGETKTVTTRPSGHDGQNDAPHAGCEHGKRPTLRGKSEGQVSGQENAPVPERPDCHDGKGDAPNTKGDRRNCATQQELDGEKGQGEQGCGPDHGSAHASDTDGFRRGPRTWGNMDNNPNQPTQHHRRQREADGRECYFSKDHAPDTGYLRPQECQKQTTGREQCNQWDEPWIEAATRLCRVDARVSNRVDRLKSLGNAVVPHIPYIIGKMIMEIEKEAT